MLSIAASALTTGYTSAMIAFDLDVNVDFRKFDDYNYGYVPDDYAARGRCFILMKILKTVMAHRQ